MNFHIQNGQVLLDQGGILAAVPMDLYVYEGRVFLSYSAVQAYQKEAGKIPEENIFEKLDASDRLIMPGLINMHTHVYMTAMRSYADDVSFDEWLFNRVMPAEERLPFEGTYWSNLLGCMEMIRTGTTCFVDMHMFEGQSARAARDIGMRGVIGRGLVGEDLYGDGASRFEEALREMQALESPLLQFILSPHAIYSCGTKLLEQVSAEAAKRGLLKQIHLSESDNEVAQCLEKHGRTPVELLSDLGFLDENTILAHCVKVNEKEAEILAGTGVTVVTNPASNAKLGNGTAPLALFQEKGLNICIGTDGAASNNSLNLFREMGLLTMVQKAVTRNAEAALSQDVLRMATVNAAKGLHRQGELGAITDGALADLVFIDLSEPSLFPNTNIPSSLCYSANGSEVESVMVGGEFVMRKREFTKIDAERVRYEVNRLIDSWL